MAFLSQPLPDLAAWVRFYSHADVPVLQRTAAHLARHMANGSDDPALPDDFVAPGKLLNMPPELARRRVLRQRIEVE